jgi:hypothetical protein
VTCRSPPKRRRPCCATLAWPSARPDGSATAWPDNFFNLADLGVCKYCAKTKVSEWGALIGYIGSAPPADGSYTSPAILPQALKIFYVGANYEAEATDSGTLWLNKNADAYSGFTSDNSGHVTAKVTIQPPESTRQLANRARVAALSANAAATALQQAATFCGNSVVQKSTSKIIQAALKKLIPGSAVSDVFNGATITGDYVKLNYDADNGQIGQAEFDLGRLVFAIIGTVPELSLFGIVGAPAIDCVEAGFWLSGQLGGQLGAWLRQKLDPPTYAYARIQGTWTLSRAVLTCHSVTCLGTPIRVSFAHCTSTSCLMTRLDAPFKWKTAHVIKRNGNTWVGSFTDEAVYCGTQINPAAMSFRISVVRTSTGNGLESARSLGGTYTIQPASDPPNCSETGLAVEEIYGNRP